MRDRGNAQTVKAVVETESAWMGEAVPLYVTLYSPGPFSGTASFDLPELPRTAIVRAGTPVIGNETVDGESVFTQRHEFSIYTQQEGMVTIPSFKIRFSGKESFLGDPKQFDATTKEVRFESKRPPDSASMPIVVTATKLEVEQTWTPEPGAEFRAGDVIAPNYQTSGRRHDLDDASRRHRCLSLKMCESTRLSPP